MIETVLLAFIAAKMRRFRLSLIFKDWAIYPVLLCATTYIYLESTIFRGDYSLIKYSNYFKAIYIACFIILAYRHNYKALYWNPLAWLGYILNMVAVKANGNKMPVFPDLTYATGYTTPEMFTNATRFGDFHILGNAYTRLIPLTDIFDIGFSIWSIGDVLIRVFVFIALYQSIKSTNIIVNKNNNIPLT